MLRKIKVLHLEPTDVCQLACPLCSRETDKEFKKSVKHHLTIPQIQQHFTEQDIKDLDKMFMCGNYGDPAAGTYTLDIYQWINKLNPSITLGMNTNAALQTTFWWHELGQILSKPKDYCVFSIDGLQDTNPVYRVNSNWDKLMANIKAYISAGGSAHWDMLVYKHNQHQVDACEQLAKDMGFRWFRAKVSKRPFTEKLEFPIGWQPAQITVDTINCHALNDQSAYIDAQGRIHPCCWLGNRQSNFVDDFESIQNSWATNSPNTTCLKICGSNKESTNFSNQWQREVKLC
jgi:MoaA/NifB/PqqE/SkfB family radical SAM enzyme